MNAMASLVEIESHPEIGAWAAQGLGVASWGGLAVVT